MISSFGYIDGPGYQRSFKLAVELSKLGHDVTFLTSQNGTYKFPYLSNYHGCLKEVAAFDIAPKLFKKLGLSIVAAFIKTVYAINKKYDVVHSDTGHRLSSGIPCWIHKRIHGTKYVSEWWDYYGRYGQYENKPLIWKYTYGYFDNYLEILDKKIADGVIVLSDYTKKRAERIGIDSSRIYVLQGGADVENIKYVSDFRFRKIFNLDADAFVIGCVGISGIEDLVPFLKIMPDLKNKINIKWFSTGKIISFRLKKEYHIGEELIEFGWVDYNKYYQLLSIADAFLLLQRPCEANMAKWPNKIGDYLCAGRVIITNPINDIGCLIKENVDSIIKCDWEDQRNLRNTIIGLYKERADLIETGKYNRQIAKKVSWNKKAKLLEAFYYKILKKHNK